MKFRNVILTFLLSIIFVVSQFGFVNAKQLHKTEKIDPSFLQSVYNSSDKEIVILKLTGLDTIQYSERKQLSVQNKSNSILEQPLIIDETYAKKIQTKQIDLFESLSNKISMKLIHSYQYVYNGIAIEIRDIILRFLINNPQIEKIFSTRDVNFPVRDIEVVTISADKAWKLSDANNLPVTGTGMRVGILDSGIDFHHGDFTPQGMGPDKKVKYGHDFADNDDDPQDKGDPPHGTHVAGIASGKNPKNSLKRGIAPDSDLYIYKVFGSNVGTANPANIVAAVEQAVVDKCHVINLSLGSPSPTESTNPGKPYYESLNNAMKMGVVVCCASGNDGSRHKNNPWPIHAPGVFDSVIQVAATDDRMTQPITIKMEDKQDIKINANRSKYSPPFKAEQSNLPVVDCGFGRVEDFDNVDVNGKIALISRGPKIAGIKYQEKNLNAKKAGAVGCIVYNYDPQPIGASLAANGEDPYSFNFIPNLTISSQLADQLKYKLSIGGQLAFEDKSYITIADFSSVGPCFSGDDNIFKPEISAPGKQINSAVLATQDANGNYTDQYQDWDGTSMATPAVTGCVALLRQAQPQYNAFDVKSVIMNTSDVLINPMNDDYFSYFYQGAGQINILNAIQSPVIIDPPVLQRNITQLDKPFEFTIRNTSDKNVDITIKTETFNLHGYKDPIKWEINNTSISLKGKEQKKFTAKIQIGKEDFINRVYQGAIWIEIVNQKDLNMSLKPLHIPLIIYKDSITKIDPSITNLKISSFDLNYKYPINNTISFDLNTGSLLVYKGIEPPVNMYENQARIFRIYTVDSKGNEWGNIYYAENLPVGHYVVEWNGMNFSGSEFLPNGNFSIMAEISGIEYTIKDGKLDSDATKNNPEIFGSSPIVVTGSSVPQPPLLIIGAVSKIELDQEFTIDILFADAKDIQNVSVTLLFSKTRTSPIGYSLGEFVDKSALNEKKDVKLDKGSFIIKAKRDPNIKGSRLKIASIRLKAEKVTTSKTGIDLSIDNFELIDNNNNIRKPYTDYPIIIIPKDNFIFGDFNEDGQVNNLDYNLLLEVYGMDYQSDNWDTKFDLNNDYLINICDLVVFSKYNEN